MTRVLWTAPNRSWQAEWSSWSAAAKSRFTDRVTNPRPRGVSSGYTLRVDIHDGDQAFSQGDMSKPQPNPADGPWGERAEVAMEYPPRYLPGTFTRDDAFVTPHLHHEGQDTWISWQVYLPASFPSSLSQIPVNYWQNVMQWKGVNGEGVPMLLLQPHDDLWDVQHWTIGSIGSCPLTRGVWSRFTMHVVWSPDPSTGSIEAWCDPISSGVMAQIVSHTVCATMETPPSGEATSQTRMGIYRNGIITGSTWAAYYGYTVALDRSAAESIAFTGKLV